MALKPGNGGTGGERDPRLDLLYRDTAGETPPAHLDAAILAAARREVGARPRALSALRRWRVPVSIAAVVVLSVSLVTLVREEGGETLLREERSPAAPPPAAPLAALPEQPAGPAKAPEARERVFASAPEELSRRRDQAADRAEAQPRAAERELARSSATPTGAPPRLDEGPAQAAAAVPKSITEGARSTAEPAAIGGFLSSQPPESAPRPEADAPQRQAPIGVRGNAADIAPPAAAPKAMPMEKRMQVEEKRMPVQRKPLADKRPPVWQGLEQEPPQKWLERLAELRKLGRTGEAEELLAEIKRRFPDYPLPGGTE